MASGMSSVSLDAIYIESIEYDRNNRPVFTGTVVLRLLLEALPPDDPDRKAMLFRVPFRTSTLDDAFLHALEVTSGFGDSVAETARTFLGELELHRKGDPKDQS